MCLMFNILAMFMVEKIGRKVLLLSGYSMTTFWMIALVFTLRQEDHVLSIISLAGYLQGFSIGPGPIPWLYNSELFPQEAKLAASCLGSCLNWSLVWFVGFCFPMLETKMRYNVFLIFIVCCLVCIGFIHRVIPETKNKMQPTIFNDFARRNRVIGKGLLEDDRSDQNVTSSSLTIGS